MKKYAKLMLMLGLAGTMLTGCKKETSETADTTPTPTPTQEAVVTEETGSPVLAPGEPETDRRSGSRRMRGQLSDRRICSGGDWKKTSVAVMLNNLKPACPQAGIANAGVVYEAPVEGGITLSMGVFEDYDNLEKIGL